MGDWNISIPERVLPYGFPGAVRWLGIVFLVGSLLWNRGISLCSTVWMLGWILLVGSVAVDRSGEIVQSRTVSYDPIRNERFLSPRDLAASGCSIVVCAVLAYL